MKRLAKFLPLVAVILVASCASTPVGKFSQTQDAFIAAVQVANSARESGTVSEADWQSDFVPVIRGLNDAMRLYEFNVRSGLPLDGSESTALNLLRQLRILIQGFSQ